MSREPQHSAVRDCPIHKREMVPADYQIARDSPLQGEPGQKFSALMCPEKSCGMLHDDSISPDSGGFFRRAEDGKPVPWSPTSSPSNSR
jgi:hypothetical protein